MDINKSIHKERSIMDVKEEHERCKYRADNGDCQMSEQNQNIILQRERKES